MLTNYPEPVDLTKILEPYEGEWVALSDAYSSHFL